MRPSVPPLGRYIVTELEPRLGRYVAIELEPKLGRYVVTELEPKLGRYAATERSSARSLRSDRALPNRRYDNSPCILMYPSMLSPKDRSEPISPFPPFKVIDQTLRQEATIERGELRIGEIDHLLQNRKDLELSLRRKHETLDKSSIRVATQRPNACSARSLRRDRARAEAWSLPTELKPKLGRYVAIELEPKLGRYVATELEPKLGRYAATERSSARSLRSDRALPKRRYDNSLCILMYPSMLSPEDRSEPISPFPPFKVIDQTLR
ncbi:hypothetical protein F2Q68_00014241 [Brassica cretica]|uniref:Uncharacterized protein n=1 Tax=Brassica cretica TaxID=69181 RepID=A0A8S9HIC3_BRACR|nr:hypothetical protein F2Q68_00014241 [Brassica cretica]